MKLVNTFEGFQINYIFGKRNSAVNFLPRMANTNTVKKLSVDADKMALILV